MAHIKIYAALILVVLASAVSGHVLHRLSDHSFSSASKLIKLSLTQEENTKEYLQPKHIKLVKQFDDSPTEADITVETEEDISEALNSSEEIKINKGQNSDEELNEDDQINETQNEEEKIENADDVELVNSQLLTESNNAVEEKIKSKRHDEDENVTTENGDDEDENNDVDEDKKDDNKVDEEMTENNKKRRESGDEAIDDNDETNDDKNENEVLDETEEQDVERKERKRQNDDENDGWEGSGEDLDDSESVVAEIISAMFENRFNSITK